LSIDGAFFPDLDEILSIGEAFFSSGGEIFTTDKAFFPAVDEILSNRKPFCSAADGNLSNDKAFFPVDGEILFNAKLPGVGAVSGFSCARSDHGTAGPGRSAWRF